MRMWNVDPELLCDKHLLGEHVETHMFVGALTKGNSVNGYIEKGLVEIHNLRSRHDALADEMLRRGIKHKSPLPEYQSRKIGSVSVKKNIKELCRRCEDCRRRIYK